VKQELHRAIGMLFRAGLKHVTADDSAILARDIVTVAGELAGEEGDPAFHIDEAAAELEKRIGGLKNLEAYMRCLKANFRPVRAPATREGTGE
jgi:hypothetical protein